MEILKIRKYANSPWQDVLALVGPKGEDGKDGENYVLTEEDKAEIAQLVLAALPSSEEVSF